MNFDGSLLVVGLQDNKNILLACEKCRSNNIQRWKEGLNL